MEMRNRLTNRLGIANVTKTMLDAKRITLDHVRTVPVALVLSLTLIASLLVPHIAYGKHQEYSTGEILQAIQGALEFTKSSLGIAPEDDLLSSAVFLEEAGSGLIDWYAFSLGRLGYEDNYESYLAAVEKNVVARYATDAKLDSTSATEWHRIGLTILALGGDPTSFGTSHAGEAINLVADGTYNRAETASLDKQGVNGYIFALLMLDALQYPVPAEAPDNRESIITGILKEQQEDGGFGIRRGADSTPDVTALALQALAPYYESGEIYSFIQGQSETEVSVTVGDAVDEALDALSNQQAPEGDFGSYGSTSDAESTAQVLVALCSLGIDISSDTRFIKDGNTVLDGLMRYQNEDGGFAHARIASEDSGSVLDDSSNLMATEQAVRALIAFARQTEGMNAFHDLRADTGVSLYSQMSVAGDDVVAPEAESTKSNESSFSVIAIAMIVAVLVIAAIAIMVVSLKRRNS